MRSLNALLRLIRWENALIAATGVLIGSWWVGANPMSGSTLSAATAAIALAAVANAFNDLHDVEIDRVAHPGRPLPSGELSRRAAKRTVVIAALVAVLLSWLATPALAAVTVVVIAVMLAYSRWIKRLGLPGNLTVALLASLPFLYGGWSAGRPAQSLVLVALAVPLHLAREVAKDMEDASADTGTRRTLPVAAGSGISRIVLVGALAIFLAALALFARQRPMFALAVTPSVVLAALATYRAFVGRSGGPLLFKSAMLVAMASLLVVRNPWTP